MKFSENIKQGFKNTISWNKYTTEITTQTKDNNLDNVVDPTFRNIIRFLVLSLKKMVMMLLRETLLINITVH